MEGVNKDNFVVLVRGILSNPVGVQNTEATKTFSQTTLQEKTSEKSRQLFES